MGRAPSSRASLSRSAGQKDDPYYPINLVEDKARYNSYRELARAEADVFFGGRLGTYRYLDMHQAIGAALKAFERELGPGFERPDANLSLRPADPAGSEYHS